MMPGMDGFEVLKAIRKVSTVPVLSALQSAGRHCLIHVP